MLDLDSYLNIQKKYYEHVDKNDPIRLNTYEKLKVDGHQVIHHDVLFSINGIPFFIYNDGWPIKSWKIFIVGVCDNKNLYYIVKKTFYDDDYDKANYFTPPNLFNFVIKNIDLFEAKTHEDEWLSIKLKHLDKIKF